MSVTLQTSTAHLVLAIHLIAHDRHNRCNVEPVFREYSVMGKMSMDHMDISLYVADEPFRCDTLMMTLLRSQIFV